MSTTAPNPRHIDPDELKIHQLYRERIVHEDNLINYRMMWMVLSEAFMLATWGGIEQRMAGAHDGYWRFAVAVVSIVGVIISIGSFTSIEAAQNEINGLRYKYFKHILVETKTFRA